MDGIEVLFELRELERNAEVVGKKAVVILMVTSHSDKDSVITSVQAECDDYMLKPFDKKMVAEKVEQYFPVE